MDDGQIVVHLPTQTHRILWSRLFPSRLFGLQDFSLHRRIGSTASRPRRTPSEELVNWDCTDIEIDGILRTGNMAGSEFKVPASLLMCKDLFRATSRSSRISSTPLLALEVTGFARLLVTSKNAPKIWLVSMLVLYG